MAKRNYPTAEVRGCSREELPGIRGQGRRLGEDTPRPRSGAAAERSYPRPSSGAARRRHLAPEAKGGDPEEPPRAQGQGQQLGGATHAQGQSRWLGGASRGVVAAQVQEGLEKLSHVEGQERRQ